MSEKKTVQNIVGFSGGERAESPEKLNEYIRVTPSGGVFVIIALAIFVVTLFIWGFYGTIPVTETVTGVVDGSNNNNITCFMDANRFSKELLTEKQAVIRMTDGTTVNGTVTSVASTPLSKEEAVVLIDNDWLSSNLVTDNYSQLISINPGQELSNYSYQLVQVSVITEEVRPISFLMR